MTCTVRPISAAAAFCCGTVALGALAAAGPAFAAPNPAPKAKAAPAPRLPARGNFVIRNAYVMTMERDAGDVANGDVHVRDGAIIAVGPKLNAPGAAVINGAGMIVLPGLVETHWHMWNSLLRSMSGEKAGVRLFPHHGGARSEIPAGRHVSGHAARGRRSDQFRHHLRARLVPQYPQPRLCRGRSARAARRPGCARVSPMAARRACPTARASVSPISKACTATGRRIPTMA